MALSAEAAGLVSSPYQQETACYRSQHASRQSASAPHHVGLTRDHEIPRPRPSALLNTTLLKMPESGSQYVSLDDGNPRGWFPTVMGNPRERKMFIALVVLGVIAMTLLGTTIYYARHACPVNPDSPTTTMAPTTSTTPTTSTSTTTPEPSSSTTQVPSSTTKKHKTTTESTTEFHPTSTTEPSTTTKKHKTTTESTTEYHPTSTTEPSTTTKKHKTTTESTTEYHPTSTTETSTTTKKHKTTTESTTEYHPTSTTEQSTTTKKHKKPETSSTTDFSDYTNVWPSDPSVEKGQPKHSKGKKANEIFY